ncbi:molybdate transport system substrate-binding protein [Chitinivorax tropicus]|uniref:Molybdate transport system substrate-binding protein n=1 Tax=Chitinivorax tropicus TaxID=714531 RepID=A0A840MQN9_9PROT|nr:molybdate ABC transporter substrate-binding protein [Chitinivorax tropicus]MBB5019407.1 molybdate transport system substrate-binding protein [Chitinivorax tropicus]
MKTHRLLTCLCFITSTSAAVADTLTIAVAANVQYAFDDLASAFKAETGHDAKASFNSSGKFVAQIMAGAPFDVFISADMTFPEKLHQQGLATAAPKPYAYGGLVVWTLHPDLDPANWQTVMQQPTVRKIAVANPKTAPYGQEAMKALAQSKLDEVIKTKLVFGESIAQTNQYIANRVADIGITAKSVVVSPEMAGKGRWVDLPKSLYQPIPQGAVILKHGAAKQPIASQAWMDFLYGPTARAILQRYGYLLP